MKMSSRIKSVITMGALLAGIGGGIATASAVSAAAVPCQDNTTCITGALQVQDPNSNEFPRNQFSVSEVNNAPMFWVNVGAAWSGGTPYCVSDLQIRPVICMGGPIGEDGGQPVITFYVNGQPDVSLTAKDIKWIHSHGG